MQRVAGKFEGISLRIAHRLGWCHMTWICYVGDFVRIVPWDSSPSRRTIWENMFGTFAIRIEDSQIQVVGLNIPVMSP